MDSSGQSSITLGISSTTAGLFTLGLSHEELVLVSKCAYPTCTFPNGSSILTYGPSG